MNRVLTFLLILVMWSLTVRAQDIMPEAAKEKAAAFLHSRINGSGGPHKISGRIDTEKMSVEDASASIYAVNTGNDAFVLVAKSSAVDDVLGYCDEGAFSPEDMPDNFRAMLHDMEQELEILASLDDPKAALAIRKASRKAVSPMIKSKWNQGEVSTTGNAYNCQCPIYTYSNGAKYYCYTGCVATAMAQYMYFYKYPKTTKKTIPGYTSNNSIGYLSSLEVTTFDWGNMQDEYLGTDLSNISSYRAMPIAKLMKYCGYASQMNYGTGSSLSSSYHMYNSMIEYFGYNPNAYLADRMDYTIEEWYDLIYNELAAGRPVLYGGSSTSSGHQFILDGIDSSGKYHVNWGWGGRYDGYYLINVLNPHTTTSAGSSKTPDGYTIDQQAVIGMQPTKTAVLTGPTAQSCQYSSSRLSFTFFNKTATTLTFYYGIGVISDGNVTKTLVKTSSASSFDPHKGMEHSITSSMLASYLTAGTHQVALVYSLDGKTWKPCPGSGVYYANVTVANNQVTSCVPYPIDGNLSAFTVKLTGNGYVNVPQEVEVSIMNNDNKTGFNGIVSMFVNGSQTTNAGLYLAPSTYDKAYFYFTPTTTGTQTLTFWVVDPYTNTMLYQIKGNRTVQITEGPNGEVEGTLMSPEAKTVGGKNYVYDTVTTLEADIYNNTRSTASGYFMIQMDGNPAYVYWNTSVNSYVHKIMSYHVEDLVKGRTYTYSLYYNPTELNVKTARKLGSYTFTVTDATKAGDVNEDGKVDISDIVAIINQIAGTASYKNADVNSDKKVDISDIVAVINIIAGSGNSGNTDWRQPTL